MTTSSTLHSPAPLDVVIVNYNTYDDTLSCVRRLLETGDVQPQAIHVVDNLSPDGSGQKLRQDLPKEVNFIASSRNGGFGAGVNLGAAAGKEPYILVLNPDCYPTEPCLRRATNYMEAQPTVGIAGLHLLNTDGSSQYSARTFYTLLQIFIRRTPLQKLFPFSCLSRRHLMMEQPFTAPFKADWVMGTGLVIRRDLFERLDGMDEAYFLYMEDVDLCVRAQIAGYDVHFLPDVRLVHDHRRSSGRALWSRAHSFHLRSLKIFFRRFGMPLFFRPTIARMAKRFEQKKR